LKEGNLTRYEKKQNDYMGSMFQQSFAIDNFQKPPERQNATIKLMDHSKETEDFQVENVEHRLKNAKKLGITDLES
jgi:hypothetical protein